VVVNDESRPGIQRFYTEDPWSNRIELVDAETPGRAAEFPGESTSRRGQCRPPDPQLRYLRNQVGGTCGFWQSLAVFVQLLQTRLFWTLLRL